MSSADARRGLRGRAGFTLIEMMVAVVIMALLTTVLYQIVRTQTRWVAFESQREDAADNARASVDVLTGELRTVIPRGVISAKDTALVLALPRAWGVACTALNANAFVAVFPGGIPSSTLTTFNASGGTGVMANLAAGSTPNWSPRPSLSGGRPQVTGVAAANVAASCASASGAALKAYTITGTGLPAVAAGNEVMLYDLVRYDVGQSDGNWWLRRSTGFDGSNFTMTPLAGPLASADSMKFTFYQNASATVAATPITNTTALDSLSRIKVKVATASSASYNGVNSRDRDSAVVLLRNRITSLQCSTGLAGAPC